MITDKTLAINFLWDRGNKSLNPMGETGYWTLVNSIIELIPNNSISSYGAIIELQAANFYCIAFPEDIEAKKEYDNIVNSNISEEKYSEEFCIKNIQFLRNVPNSVYYRLKYSFNYHSNKIEGSTFSLENIIDLMENDVITGNHKYDDIVETKNSLELFDFVIDTLHEPISEKLIMEFHSILKKGTRDDSFGFRGCYKKIPNEISNSDVKLSQPYEVTWKIEELFKWYNSKSELHLKDIAEFHLRFERIHPFQDGNGRIGRFLMLKQRLQHLLSPIMITENNEISYKKSMQGDADSVHIFLQACEVFKFIK